MHILEYRLYVCDFFKLFLEYSCFRGFLDVADQGGDRGLIGMNWGTP